MEKDSAPIQAPAPSISYWGKADPAYAQNPKWHPLIYHSLDVRELAQVVQRKPKGNPPLEPGLTSQRHGKKPALRRRAPEVL